MLLSLASVLALIAATVSSVAASPILATTDTTITAASTPSLPFNFTQIFTASLALGNASSQIPIPGGALINEPIAGGSVTGSAVNGTIQGGFAHPPIYNNGTLQVAEIDVYGVTSDGQAFYIHEEGVGSNSAQVTRIITIGGAQYASLADGFILASVNANAARTQVSVQGYLVENTVT